MWMENKSLIILFPKATSGDQYLQQIKTLLESDTTLELFLPISGAEISEKTKSFEHALLIFSVREKADLVEVMNVLAAQQDALKQCSFRAIGTSFLSHPEVAKLLTKRGCSDLLETSLSQKALKHKISQSLKILKNNRSQKQPEESKLPSDSQQLSSQQASIRGKPMVRKIPAVTIASDCWLIQSDKNMRQVQGSWIIDVLGPGPSAGSWEETQKDPKCWTWKPRASADQPSQPDKFVVESGEWTFKGRRPEFIWQENFWRFVGDLADLSFFRDQQVSAVRFRATSELVLEVAENSPQANEKLPLIMRSIDPEMRFTKEAQKNKTADLRLEQEGGGKVLDFREARPQNEGIADATFSDKILVEMWLSEDGLKKNSVPVTPLEYSETELVLEVPAALFVEGQKLKIGMSGIGGSTTPRVYKVTFLKIQNCDKTTDLLTIQVEDGSNFPNEELEKANVQRQSQIFDFLTAARGW
jgi:hypothetical protein